MTAVVSYYTTQFGELWEKSLYELVEEASKGVIDQHGKIEKGHIDAIFYGNMMAGILENNLHSPARIAEMMGLHVPAFRVEAACASGGMAFHLACNYVASGKAKTVMVIGAEKMTDYAPDEVISALSAAASGEEQEAGLTFPGLYGMLARHYLETYKYTEEHLAYISVKNHYHGTMNTKAQFKKKITVEDVMNSPYVASPLKILDSSPITDGASAVIVTSDPALIARSTSVAYVRASEVATDSISLANRKSLDGLEVTSIAAGKAFDHADVKPDDIDIAEVHDCFSIAEIMAMEDIGFWKKGEGGARAKEHATMHGKTDSLVVNMSGGLKAAGHPVAATGVKQIGEVYLHLTGQADGGRQAEGARLGLAHNVGGSGGTAVVTILGNEKV